MTMPATMISDVPMPARPCERGHRGAWRRTKRGGWYCHDCEELPETPIDDFGLRS